MKISEANANTAHNNIIQTATTAKSAGLAAAKSAREQKPAAAAPKDTLVVSEEARQSANDMQKKLEEMRSGYRMLLDELRRAQEAGSGMADAIKEKIKCMRIAMRIMSGGVVPIEDKRYLAEKDPQLYFQAISLRVEKEDPEEYERLSDEEDKDKPGATNSAGGGIEPPASAAAAGAATSQAAEAPDAAASQPE